MEKTNKELRYELLVATDYNVDNAAKCYAFVEGADQPKAEQAARPDGIYFVLDTPDGRKAVEYSTRLSDQQKEQCIGIGVQRGGLSFCVALYEHREIELLPDGKKAKKRACYLDRECDALHDADSEGNTRLLAQDNPKLREIIGEGWNIPALAVLVEICWLRNEINQALEIVGGEPLTDTWYWGSTEHSESYAWYVYFINGSTWGNNKYNGGAVRAVAAF